jgi:hypothetical protein
MRQRAFVILNPYVIPRIDPAVARLASEKMFGLTNATPVGALAEHGTPWSGLLDGPVIWPPLKKRFVESKNQQKAVAGLRKSATASHIGIKHSPVLM